MSSLSFLRVKMLRKICPMHVTIVVMNDVVPIIESSSVDKRVDAIVCQSIVDLGSRWIHEDMLRPIAEAKGQEGYEDRHDEHPEGCPKAHVLGEKDDRGEPNEQADRDSPEPLVPLRLDAVIRQL